MDFGTFAAYMRDVADNFTTSSDAGEYAKFLEDLRASLFPLFSSIFS